MFKILYNCTIQDATDTTVKLTKNVLNVSSEIENGNINWNETIIRNIV